MGELWWSWFDAYVQSSAIGEIGTSKETNSKSRDHYEVLKHSLQMPHFSPWSCCAPSVGADNDGKRQKSKEALASVQHCSVLLYPHAISNASEANPPSEDVGRIFFLPFLPIWIFSEDRRNNFWRRGEREKWKCTFGKSFTIFMKFS